MSGRAAEWLRVGLLWHQPFSFSRSVVLAVLVVGASLVLGRSAYTVDGATLSDGHAILSLELATARAFCGSGSAYSRTIRIPSDLGARMDRRHAPLRALIAEKAGSIDAYCALVDTPYVNSENSLMLMETAILRLVPDISLAGLGQFLHVTRIAGLALFVLLLITLGASLALALATMLLGLMRLQALPEYVYSNYPFFFVMVLALVAVHAFAVRYHWTTRPAGLVSYGIGAGVLTAFVANMRTTYLPVAALFFLCVLLDDLRPRSRETSRLRRGVRTLALASCFVAGYAAFQTGLITRTLPDEGRFNAAHPFGHPLVLALGVPESDFSRGLGIRWADEVGPRIAERIDPGVPFLGPRYNAALLSYYASLWRTQTSEMFSVYYLKFSVAGADMIQVLRGSPGLGGWWVSVLLWPFALVPSGVWLLAGYAVITVAALAVAYRRDNTAAFALGLLSLAACLLQVESGVIFSTFVKQYHSYAAFYVLFLALLGVQAIGNGAWALWSRPRPVS